MKAKRISAPSQSYKKDNPAEYAKVKAYIDGGARPSGVTTEMGMGLVEVEDVKREEVPPIPPDPPDPPVSGPITISAGGTYTGNWSGSGSQTIVNITTTAPVTILNSKISTTGWGQLVVCGAGSQVTIRNSVLSGVKGQCGQAVKGGNIKSLLVENCDINYTWGIRADSVQAGGSFIVRYCKVRNIQRYNTDPAHVAPDGYAHFFQTASNGNTNFTCECAWNDVVSTWGQGQGSDIISIHSTLGANPKIHDNYLEGSFVDQSDTDWSLPHSGSGIMHEQANNCDTYNNIIVACTNCGIGMAAGANNKIHDNRCISSGKTPDGNVFKGANVGIYCYDSGGGNQPYNNFLGWMGHPGGSYGRNDWYLPMAQDWYSKNTNWSPGNYVITRADEQAEYQRWLAKVVAAGVKIGA